MPNNRVKEIELTNEQLRQLQLVQLEILIEFDRICRKNNINYSLDGGTLLGAVRHKGFIPWDDDIDIIILRKDYDKFYEACKKDLNTDKFFLQEERTDKYYYTGFPRMRRKNSVLVRAGHEHMKYQRGVFIDIFVLDNVPDGKLKRDIHKFSCFILRKMLWAQSAKKIHPKFGWRVWFSIVSLVPRDLIFFFINRLAKKHNKKQTELVRHLTHPYPNPKV